MIELLWTWTCSRCGIEAMGDNGTMERAAAKHVKQTGHSVILSGAPPTLPEPDGSGHR